MEGDFIKKKCCGEIFGHNRTCYNYRDRTLEECKTLRAKTPKKVILRSLGSYKDGGSTEHIGDDKKHYWEDRRIGSETKGVLFEGKYKDTAKRAKGDFEMKHTINRCRSKHYRQ